MASQQYLAEAEILNDLMKTNAIQILTKKQLALISNRLFVKGNEVISNVMKGLELFEEDSTGAKTKAFLSKIVTEYGTYLTKATDIKHLSDILKNQLQPPEEEEPLETQERDLEEKVIEFRAKEEELTKREQELAIKEQGLTTKDQDLTSKERDLDTKEQVLIQNNQQFTIRERELKHKESDLAAKILDNKETEDKIKQSLADLDSKTVEANNISDRARRLEIANKTKALELDKKELELIEKERASRKEKPKVNIEYEQGDIPETNEKFKLDNKSIALFFGKKEEIVANWIIVTNNTMIVNKIPDKHRISCVLPYLRDAALQFTLAYVAQNGYENWQSFTDKLKQTFEPIDLQRTLRMEIKYIQCSGSIDDYNRQFLILANRIVGLSEQDKLLHYTEGLRSKTRYEVDSKNPTRLDDAIIIATNYEHLTNPKTKNEINSIMHKKSKSSLKCNACGKIKVLMFIV